MKKTHDLQTRSSRWRTDCIRSLVRAVRKGVIPMFCLLMTLLSLSGYSQITSLEEGFENTFPPDGWEIKGTKTSQWSAHSYYYHTGYYCARHNYDYSGCSNFLITPQIAAKTGMTLSFYAKLGNINFADDSKLYIEVSTSTSDTANFTQIQAIDLSDTYQKYDIDLSEYNGQNIYIAFHVVDNNGIGIYVDDVFIPNVDCPAPTDIVSSFVTDNGTLSFTGSADSYDFEYELVTADWNDDNISSETNSITLSDLLPGTNYKYKLRSNCGTDGTSQWILGTFTTQCLDELTIDEQNTYVEDFESYQVSDFPNCLTMVSQDDNHPSNVASIYANGGTKALAMYASANCQKPIIALPKFTNDLSTLRVSLYARYESANSGSLQIGYITDLEDSSTFVALKTIEASSTWKKYTADLDYYAEQLQQVEGTPYIAIRQNSGVTSSYNFYYIDSVQVMITPDCKGPSDLTVSNLTATSANLSWLSTAATFNITVKDENNTEVASLTDITETNYDLTELTTLTTYTVTIAGFCSDGTPTDVATISFKTPCEAIVESTLPYQMDFENETAANYSLMNIACWTILEKAQTSYDSYPNVLNYSAHNGNNCMRLYNTTSNGNMVALPGYQGNIKDLQLSAYIKPGGTTQSYGQIEIGVMTDLNDTTSFHVAKTIVATQLANTEYKPYDVIFSGLDFEVEDGVVYYPVIKYPTKTYGYAWYIDDIVLDKVPECPAPNNIAVSEITTNSAEVTWSQYGDIAAEWTVFYKKTTDTEWTEKTANETTYTLNDLASGTDYEVKVASVCGESVLTSNEKVTFKTQCVPLTMDDLPYYNGFENETKGLMPNCWSAPIAYLSGSVSYPSVYDYTARTGSKDIYFSNGTSSTLMITLNGYQGDITELQLVAWAKPNGTTSSYGKMQVGFMTDNTDTNTFVVVKEYLATDWPSSVYDEMITPFNTLEDFTADVDAVYYPAIKYISGGNYYQWYIDDVTLEIIPECAKPTKLAATPDAITSTTATLTWQQSDENTSWVVYYKKTTETEYQTQTVSGTPTITLTDLNPATIYDAYVEVVCAENVASNPIQFKTACPDEITITDNDKYIEDFETYIVGATPDCWTSMTPVSSSYYTSGVVSQSKSGNNSFRLYIPYQDYGANGTTQPMYALPKFSNDLETLRLSFYAKVSSSYSCGDLQIGYLTNLTDTSSFVLLKSYTASEVDSSWNLLKINMADFSETIVADESTDKYIALRHNKPGYTGYSELSCYIDSLSVGLAPSCSDPNGLVVSDIDVTSANITWNGDASSYNVKVVVDGTNEVIINETNVTENTFAIENLTDNTSYVASVTGVCEDGGLTDPISALFHTRCVAMDIPWETSFEDLNTTSLYYCWTKLNTASYNPTISGYNSKTGANSMYFYTHSGDNTIIALPRFTEDITTLRLTFNSKPTGNASSYGRMRVGLTNSLNMADTANIVYVWEKSATQYPSTNYFEEVVDFGEATIDGENIYIVFNHDNASSAAWYIDDVSVDLIPDCDKARNLKITDVTAESATLSWTVTGSQTDFNVYYKKTSDMNYSEATADGLTASLTDLEASTEYEVYVKNTCDDGTTKISETIKFKTPCAAITIDGENNYVQDFESYNNLARVDCWEVVAEASSYPIKVITESKFIHSGSKALKITSNEATPNSIISLPQFTNDLSTLRVQFYGKSEGPNGGDMELGYITDLNDPTSFVALASWPKTQTTWTLCKTDLSTYSEQLENAGSVTLALREVYTGTSYWSWGIDSLVVSLIPACSEASDITATDITETSATISWTSNASASNIVVKDAANTEIVSEENYNGTSYDLTGLTGNTVYTVSITSVCDDGSTTEATIYSFKTLCGSYTISEDNIYTEGFEYGSSNQYPDCWTTVVDGTNTKAGTYSGGKTGNYSFALKASFSDCKQPMVAMPVFTNDLSTLRVQFYAAAENSTKSGNLEFGYLTDLADSSTFVVLKSWPNSMTSWTLCKIDLGMYADQLPQVTDGVRLAFRHNNPDLVSSWYYYSIDDVVVKLSPDCIEPNDLAISNLAVNSATLSWTSSASEFSVVVKDAANTVVIDEAGINANSYDLSGLESNTVYTATVTSICGGIESEADETTSITFRTPCVAITEDMLPITWDFESDNTVGSLSYPLPSCWQRVTANNNPYVYNYYPYQGSKCLYFTGGNDGMAVMREIDASLPVNSLQLTFYAKKTYSYYTGSLNIGVMTDPTDKTTFTSVETIDLTSDYTKYEIVLNGYEGTGTYIAFSVTSNNSANIALDSLTLEKMPSCAKIKNTSFTSTTTSAIITLNDANPDLDYNVYYRPSGSTEDYVVVAAVEGVASISNLIASSTYEYYVESVCIEGDNAISDIFTFKTACDVVTVTDATPWSEDFTTTDALDCWTLSSSGDKSWNISEGALYHAFYVNDSSDAVTPVFDLTGVTNPYVAFKHMQKPYQTVKAEELKVFYRASETDDWTELADYTTPSSSLVEDTLALPNKSATYQLNFRMIGKDALGVKVDDLIIFNKEGGEQPQPCDAPTSLTVTSKTQTSATITWAGSAASYDVQLGENASQNVTATTYTFNNLTAGTTYTAKVRANCGETTSDWVTVTFTTDEEEQPTCEKVTNLVATTTYNSAILTWNGDAASYDVQLGENTPVNVTASSYTFNDLTASTTYTAKVRANCGNGLTSEWTSVNFTTDAEPAEDCDAPTNVTASEITQTTAVISWEGTAETYEVTVGDKDPVNVSAKSYACSGLTANTTYTVKVRSICGDGKMSEAATATFKTLENSGLTDVEDVVSVKAYPNPTTDNATLEIKGINGKARVIVTDVNGRVIDNVNVSDGVETITIDSERYASGVYYIRVMGEGINKTTTLIKK